MTFPIGNWTENAACARTDAETFFPDQGASPRKAKAICATCPSASPCLAWALEHDIHHGVWGATTAKERAEMRRDAEGGVAA